MKCLSECLPSQGQGERNWCKMLSRTVNTVLGSKEDEIQRLFFEGRRKLCTLQHLEASQSHYNQAAILVRLVQLSSENAQSRSSIPLRKLQQILWPSCPSTPSASFTGTTIFCKTLLCCLTSNSLGKAQKAPGPHSADFSRKQPPQSLSTLSP